MSFFAPRFNDAKRWASPDYGTVRVVRIEGSHKKYGYHTISVMVNDAIGVEVRVA